MVDRSQDGGGGGEWDLTAYLRIRRRRDHLLRPVVRGLARLGVSPLAISLLGVALAAVACWALDRAATMALVAFLAALACDALDGALARHRGSARGRGKLIDHACDTATFLLILFGIARCGLSPQLPLVFAAAISAPLLVFAIYARRLRAPERRPGLSGGFLAHFYKAPIYSAFLLYSAGVIDVLEPAVRLADLTALASLALLLGLARPSHAAALRRRSAAAEVGR